MGNDLWKEGTIGVNIKSSKSVFHYWIKQYDEGSEYGIDGGRISKLMIKRGGEIVANYDRGWDIEPQDEDAKIALQIILQSDN